MAIIVTGDQYRELDGQLLEVKRQLRQKEGYPFDPERLKCALQAIIEGRFEAVIGNSLWQTICAACQQFWVNPDFTEARFPLEPVALDEADWEMGEHHFAETVTVEEGLRRLTEMASKGEFRLPTGSRLAMKYIAAHPDAQLDHPVILPLRAQDSDGDWVVPFFGRRWRDDRKRSLDLCRLGNLATPGCGWLVLRKRPLVTG